MENFTYSINEENFMDLDDVLDEIKMNNSEDGNIQITQVFRGTKVPFTHSDFFDADDIVEAMSNRAYEAVDELSEVYCSCLEVKEHEEGLKKIVLEYLDKNVEQPNFFNVENIEKIAVSELK